MADNPALERTDSEEKQQENVVDSDVGLNDDKSGGKGYFQGATLELKSAGEEDPAAVKFSGTILRNPSYGDDDDTSAAQISRNRPGSAFGKKSTVSVGSRTSMSPRIIEDQLSTKMYFSYKDGSFEAAVEASRAEVVKPELDGDLTGAWLLTEVDHWNHDIERLLLLTSNSLIICKYNFITSKLLWYRRIMLHLINRIQIGDFQFPKGSLMPAREHGGYRIHWGREEDLTFGQRWNPFSSDIPYLTLAHHRIIYSKDEHETITYNVDDFYESLMQAVTKVYRDKGTDSSNLKPEEGPIMIYCYAGLTSMVFNQSFLGFNRDRNGVSF